MKEIDIHPRLQNGYYNFEIRCPYCDHLNNKKWHKTNLVWPDEINKAKYGYYLECRNKQCGKRIYYGKIKSLDICIIRMDEEQNKPTLVELYTWRDGKIDDSKSPHQCSRCRKKLKYDYLHQNTIHALWEIKHGDGLDEIEQPTTNCPHCDLEFLYDVEGLDKDKKYKIFLKPVTE